MHSVLLFTENQHKTTDIYILNQTTPPQVKRGVVISLVNRALNICSDSYITAELDFIRDILYGNGYLLLFINNTINRRVKRHSHKINDNLPCEIPDKPQHIIYLPYIPKISRNLKKVCTQNNLYVLFTNNLKIINLLNFGKNKTPVTRQRGVYQIPCDCGKFYVGRTHQHFEKPLQKNKDDITKALNSTITSVSFDSALSSHVFKNPSHKILFKESTIRHKASSSRSN